MTAYCSHRVANGFGVFTGDAPLAGLRNMVAWIVRADPLARFEGGYVISRPHRRTWIVKALNGEIIAEATCPAHGFTIAVRYLEQRKE
jgi:hypothetical protein